MKRGDINIFGTSFLDLLSGALAAVIILFIIVPKMSQQQIEVLAEIERLNVQVEELDEMTERLREYVPPEIMQELERQMDELRRTISDLENRVENLQESIAAVEADNQRLREEVESLSQCCENNDQLQDEVERLREDNQRLRERVAELEQTQQQEGISDGKVFGVDAAVGVTCLWPENIDIDLYVKNLATDEVCYFSKKNTDFGNLLEDIITRSSDDDRFELFYQKRPVPGRYLISVNIYSGQSFDGAGKSRTATVNGYVVMNPGKRNQIKIPYGQKHLSVPGKFVNIGVLVVTENNISLEQ